jgi:hypothetical protein
VLVVRGARTSPPNKDDLAALKDEVARLGAQQQMLAALGELKEMMQHPGQPILKPPPTMSVAGCSSRGISPCSASTLSTPSNHQLNFSAAARILDILPARAQCAQGSCQLAGGMFIRLPRTPCTGQ